jgi:hypothetical protein
MKFEKVESDVYEALAELLAQVGSDKATLKTMRAPEIEHNGVLIVMQPTNPGSARITADAMNGDATITLCFGRSTPVEVFIAEDVSLRDEVRSYCRPVMEGKFREEVSMVGEEIIASKAVIEVDGKKHSFYYRGGFQPFKRARKETYEYAPY